MDTEMQIPICISQSAVWQIDPASAVVFFMSKQKRQPYPKRHATPFEISKFINNISEIGQKDSAYESKLLFAI